MRTFVLRLIYLWFLCFFMGAYDISMVRTVEVL
jgi:hypothetical protein